jgi:hypothetical protein
MRDESDPAGPAAIHPSSLIPHPPQEDPEDRPRGRNGRYPGDDDRSQASGDDEGEESPPTDGRQLLGWAAKQVPDAKGLVMSLGKRRGFPSKIVSWTSSQVQAAYRYARAQSGR